MDDLIRRYPLHERTFAGDVRQVAVLLRTHDVCQKDTHECIQLLLSHGASVKMKNALGWSPLAEAISFGNRQTIASLLRKLKQQSREAMETRRPDLVRALNQMGDFYMELKWDFQSWVPLVSRLLPSDICRIRKKGSSIRLDTTLVDFNDMRWERGDVSFIFSGNAKPSQSLTVLDNEQKVYQKVRYEETEAEIEDEIDLLMSSDIVSVQMSTKSITFSRAQTGWIFRGDRTEMVGPFLADFYFINGLVLESRKRREHLTQEDVIKNKAIVESFTKGSATGLENSEFQRRKSLTAPLTPQVTWEEYITATQGKPPHLGRQMVSKESVKNFKAILAMSEEFPLSVESLLNVLEVIAPFKHFNKLREFVQMKLPPGFPVKIDIPILPTVTARITFQDFQFRNEVPDSLFEIPSNYQEDPGRFPDL
ncbi:ankyrin repeat domain-containing protein 13C-like isoform X2 [Limulus polyphemus]|uniref:Ankyrin repeat domain-containing protein 13C-like isoform X2 n=1 Tax=Limulus polyphemus TaxID=6850 RepID=A0ABM1T491_LIMPO|nr:ankyrin repeat domain-containing protein 13C-like isoform X2 [Limulus polyphemus]